MLKELRERPAGTVRITSSAHAARAALWPVVDRLTAENPDIHVEISIDSGLVDIISDRFDAGVRLGKRLDQDMIAMPTSPKLRMAVFAAPSDLERCGTPQTPYDLAKHSCISLRMTTSGGLYAWEFERDGKESKVKTQGQLVFNDADLIVAAALAGRGIAFTVEGHVARYFANGAFVPT